MTGCVVRRCVVRGAWCVVRGAENVAVKTKKGRKKESEIDIEASWHWHHTQNRHNSFQTSLRHTPSNPRQASRPAGQHPMLARFPIKRGSSSFSLPSLTEAPARNQTNQRSSSWPCSQSGAMQGGLRSGPTLQRPTEKEAQLCCVVVPLRIRPRAHLIAPLWTPDPPLGKLS